MSIFKLMMVVAVSAFSASFANAEEPKTREQIISINEAYIPSGFDSNSEVFVVVSGLFPNSCYRFHEAKVEHVGPTLHQVTSSAIVTEGLCLMVLMPFSKEVQLGKLGVGTHSIHFMSGDGTFWEKTLTIEN